MDRKEKINYLAELYHEESKHSQYQSLPECLKKVFPCLPKKTKWERERLNYIDKILDFSGKKVLDIGGNTGYFSFEAIERGASYVDYYEGNQTHAEFVKLAAEILEIQNINVYPEYYLFKDERKKYDIVFCLNVIHHFGDDYGETYDIVEAKEKMLACINALSENTLWLILQMGFNWCGDKSKPLFLNGLKTEMEKFIQQGTESKWEIIKTGIPIQNDNGIEYEDINKINNERVDYLGEFLNRPLFIMKAKK